MLCGMLLKEGGFVVFKITNDYNTLLWKEGTPLDLMRLFNGVSDLSLFYDDMFVGKLKYGLLEDYPVDSFIFLVPTASEWSDASALPKWTFNSFKSLLQFTLTTPLSLISKADNVCKLVKWTKTCEEDSVEAFVQFWGSEGSDDPKICRNPVYSIPLFGTSSFVVFEVSLIG